MTRPTCKLMGIEFGAPLSLDEVPEMPGDRGDDSRYFYVRAGMVSGARDHSRQGMRNSVARGFTFRNEEDADRCAEALTLLSAHLIKSAV